jgi:nucleoside-diphosphate-sugar epimerase
VKIFIAGATGAIGQPLIAELIRQGHAVTGMTTSAAGAAKLARAGAGVARVSALDAPAVDAAIHDASPDVIIDELTSLPRDPADMAASFKRDRQVRIEGGGNLLRAAVAHGVRRYIQQSSGFFLAPGPGLGDESQPLAVDASPRVSLSSRSYTELEDRLAAAPLEGIALRYGFFYGPNTWYNPDGAVAEQVRQQHVPIIGKGEGVYSWVHIDDAATATVAALNAPPGKYHVVDDDPSPLHVWLPAFARFVGAPPPPHLTEEQALAAAGEDTIYYQTKLRGASNAKAKRALGFRPRRLEWLV